MKRLAIISTHPIQYNAPLFKMMNESKAMEVRVFFTKPSHSVEFDPDFGQNIQWDIPLTEGYPHSTYDASTKRGKKGLLNGIQLYNPHAILVYGWNPKGHLNIMRSFHGKIPIWFRGDSHLLDPIHPLKRTIRKIWLRWVYSHIDLAISVGKANTAYFQWAGVDPMKIRSAPHAVHNEYFSENSTQHEQNAQTLKEKWGIRKDATCILFAGKLETKKQPEFLLEVWKTLPEPKPYLIFAGEGELKRKLQNSAAHLDKVILPGFINQTEMPALYRTANVFCLPSSGPGETWGLCINESIASGVRCIVSTMAGVSQEFESNQWVNCCSFDNHDCWKQTIKTILSTDIPASDWREQFLDQYHFNALINTITKEFA